MSKSLVSRVIYLIEKMYLYSFTKYAGFDRVFLLKDWNLNFQAGDLIQSGSDFFLVLWEEISFSELYTTLYTWPTNFSLAYKNLLSEPTLQLLHRMTYERYTSYKNVMKLFLDSDIEKLILKELKISKKKQKINFQLGKITIQNEKNGQILVVFPDLWTFSNTIDLTFTGGMFLSSLDTQSKKNSNWRKIKTWNEKLIFCTWSEIFQDFNAVEKIYLVEPQKWYYASQQDPRYKVETVLQKMGELYNTELITIESEML